MAKFSADDKLSAVLRYVVGKETHASIAASIGATKSESFRKAYTG